MAVYSNRLVNKNDGALDVRRVFGLMNRNSVACELQSRPIYQNSS
jgi:hypothetical protein